MHSDRTAAVTVHQQSAPNVVGVSYKIASCYSLKTKQEMYLGKQRFVFILAGQIPKEQVCCVIVKNTQSHCVDGDACDRECIQTCIKKAADKCCEHRRQVS